MQNSAKFRCLEAPGALKPLSYAHPTTGLQSKFNMPQAVAAGLVEDSNSTVSFTDAAVLKPEIEQALRLIEVFEDELCFAHEPNYKSRSYGARGTVIVEASAREG